MLLSVLGALALAHVVGVINPDEKVNGLWLVAAAMSWLIGSTAAGWRLERALYKLTRLT